jgi:hypothetical protein
MAARPGTPALAPAAVIRAAAMLDIVLGIAIAVFGDSVVPMGEIAPGVRLCWVVGGLLALGGVGALVIATVLDRRRRAAAPADDAPVQR